MQFFQNNPWLNVIFLVLSVLSIFLAFYFYRESLREKKPFYDLMSFSLLTLEPIFERKIEIKFGDKRIESLLVTKISIWNGGREPIRAIDFIPTDRLRILAIGEIEIFDIEIEVANPSNNIRIEKIDSARFEISFDYLDYNEGLTVNVFHSIKKNSSIQVAGKFIGAKSISNGNSAEQLTDFINKLINPFENLLTSKWILKRILGFILRFTFAIIIMTPIIVILTPLIFSFIYLDNRKKGKFLLDRKSRG